MKLLFRNSRNERIECLRYNLNDAPLYVEPITNGKHKGYYIDVLRNVIISVDSKALRYAAIVNEGLKVVSYYNDDCELIELSTPISYTDIPFN